MKLPIGIQNFEKLRLGGFLYVDKTRYYRSLLDIGNYLFIARPRRFGKSLMLSTLKARFEGKKELFKGLWMEQENDWAPKPVIFLDFNAIDYRIQPLEIALDKAIMEQADLLGVVLPDTLGPKEKLTALLRQLRQSVILIDEYDKPITDYLGAAQADVHLDILKNFFGVLKSQDAHIHFCLLTGVSKYGKVSAFSDLNHLQDVTFSPVFSGMLGITQTELEHYFESDIASVVQYSDMDRDELLVRIKRWYNGYSWDGAERVYCPFSVLNFFSPGNAPGYFRHFWFETGTPRFLTKLLLQSNTLPLTLEWTTTNAERLYQTEPNHLDPISLLVQSGYLTIKAIATDAFGTPSYTLAYPNEEVRGAFSRLWMAEYLQTDARQIHDNLANQLKIALQAKNWPSFFQILNTALSNISHHIFRAEEAWFHAMTHLALTLTGLQAISEYSTSNGRIDDVLFDGETVYIFEYKLDRPAEEALEQIHHKQYALPFSLEGKKILGIGIQFGTQSKQAEAWVVKEITWPISHS